MPGSRNILLQKILRMELDKAGGCTVRAGKPLCLRYSPVHNQMHVTGRRKDGAEHGGCSHFHAGELPEFVGRSKGDTGNAQRAAEIPRDKGFVVRGYIQIELRLLPVAQKHGLDNAYANLGVNMLAVLHSKPGVRINPFKRNGQGLEGLVYFLLQGRRESLRRRANGVTHFKHIHKVNKN